MRSSPLVTLFFLSPLMMAHEHFSQRLPHHSCQFTAQIRSNLRIFHQNLDQQKWDSIEKGLSPDYYWNYDGTIILTPPASRAALQYVAGTMLGGVHAQDVYNIVDGNRGAVFFRISGKQGADFFDVPLQSSPGLGLYNVRAAERFVFNADGLAREVTTITPIGIMKDQMRGKVELPPSEESFRESAQTTSEFREFIKSNMASLHLNLLAGNGTANKLLAEEDVENDENGNITVGREAFARLVSASNFGSGSFPSKAFHDVDILADGTYGAIEYVWTGEQKTSFDDIPPQDGVQIKARGMLFFEFSEAGLVRKAFSVYDEGVIRTMLTNPGVYSYP